MYPATVNFRDRVWTVFDTPQKDWYPPFWDRVQSGIWEPQTFNIFDRFLKPEMTYLDLGAWIGPTVMYAAPMAKRAIAVEPDPIAFPILQRHVNANKLDVELYNGAVTWYNGTIELGSALLGASTTRANPSGAGRQPDWASGQTCIASCSTLRDFLKEYKVSGPLFIKMDIEGGEEDVLKDLELFEEYKPTLYLSLHPFWWRTQQSWETIRKVARLYNNVYDSSINKINVDASMDSEVLFAD